jgi:hypothetical protein
VILFACLNEMAPEPNRTPALIAVALLVLLIGAGAFLLHRVTKA